MHTIRNITEKIRTWLNTGTSSSMLIKKKLVIAAGVLIIYRLGYAVGKLLFHIGS